MHSPEDNDQATRLLYSAPAKTTDVTSTDTNRKQLSTGSLLKDRFELLEEIGRGGMGTVYKALDKRDIEAEQTTFLAVKVLNDELQADNALLKALHSEAKKSQELAHPNIVTVYDFDREDNHIFMTMEYMDGVSLDRIIDGNPNGLPLDQALSIIDQLGAALAYAHSRHIIHSDFKPSNVFFSRDKRVKVIDFGIARVVKSERKEKFDAGILRGLTPAYASLEMFREEEPDPKDDIYALACVAYELLTGHHPYDRQRADAAKRQGLEPKKPRQLNKKQWAVLRSGLELDRNKRIGNVTDFYQGLHARKKNPLQYLALPAIPLAIVALIVFREPLSAYWQRHFSRSSAPPQDSRSPSVKAVPAVFSGPQYACLRHKRTLMTIRLETRASEQDTLHISFANPGLSALVYQAVQPYGLEIVEAKPAAHEAHAELRQHYNLDYLLNATLSAREIPITTVKTAMTTVQGRITLELLNLSEDRIVNTASAEFKQPGLDMLDIIDQNLQKNIGNLATELFKGACS